MTEPSITPALFRPSWGWVARVQLGALLATYHLALIIYLLLAHTVGEAWRIIAFTNNIAHLLLWFAIPTSLLALLMPLRRYWLPFTVVPLLAVTIFYGEYAARHLLPQASAESALVIQSYNLSGLRQMSQTLDVLLANPADIAGLQEFSNHPALQDEIAQLETIYPYRISEGLQTTISRYPLREPESESISMPPRTVYIRTLVDAPQGTIAFYNVHLPRPISNLAFIDYDDQLRRDALTKVLERMAQETVPIILVCDCNMGDRTADYQRLDNVLVDAWRQAGRGIGLTAPSNRAIPLIRSDYIWLDDELRPVTMRVLPDRASDHYAIEAHIAPQSR